MAKVRTVDFLPEIFQTPVNNCLLYTSDAADE